MFLLPKLGSGGLEQLAKQWYSVIENYGMKYCFVVLNEGGETSNFFANKNYDIFTLSPIGKIGVCEFIKQFYTLLRKEKFDIVHVPASRTSWIVLAISMLTGCKKRIIHAHTNYYNAAEGNASGKICLKLIQILNKMFATCRLTASNSAAEYCYGCKNDAIMVRNGIDTKKFTFSESKRNAIRGNLGLNDCFVIGNIGRFTEQKNQKFCIDVLCELKKNYSVNCKLLLVGEGKDELMLKDVVHKNNLDSDVFFLGTKDDPSSFYSAMDAFVFPSLFEGLGIVAIEAQCEGLMTYISEYVPEDAVVSSNAKRIPLSDGAKTWAKNIWENRKNRMRNAVLDVVKSGYEFNDSVKKMVEVYMDVMHG